MLGLTFLISLTYNLAHPFNTQSQVLSRKFSSILYLIIASSSAVPFHASCRLGLSSHLPSLIFLFSCDFHLLVILFFALWSSKPPTWVSTVTVTELINEGGFFSMRNPFLSGTWITLGSLTACLPVTSSSSMLLRLFCLSWLALSLLLGCLTCTSFPSIGSVGSGLVGGRSEGVPSSKEQYKSSSCWAAGGKRPRPHQTQKQEAPRPHLWLSPGLWDTGGLGGWWEVPTGPMPSSFLGETEIFMAKPSAESTTSPVSTEFSWFSRTLGKPVSRSDVKFLSEFSAPAQPPAPTKPSAHWLRVPISP